MTHSQKKIVVIAGPSGSGKNTVIRRLLGRCPKCSELVTATTRIAREREEDGTDYYFFTPERFDEEVAAGNIVGQRFVPLFGGTHYGIYLPDLKKKLEKSKVIFASVDITGAGWLKENYNAVTIFITPESFEQFRSRIRVRNPELGDAEYAMRLRITEEEMRVHAPKYDHRVVNADGAIEETVENIITILQKEGYDLDC